MQRQDKKKGQLSTVPPTSSEWLSPVRLHLPIVPQPPHTAPPGAPSIQTRGLARDISHPGCHIYSCLPVTTGWMGQTPHGFWDLKPLLFCGCCFRCLPPALMTWVWSLEPTRWKDKTSSCRLSYGLCLYVKAWLPPPCPTSHTQNNFNAIKKRFIYLSRVPYWLADWIPSWVSKSGEAPTFREPKTLSQLS